MTRPSSLAVLWSLGLAACGGTDLLPPSQSPELAASAFVLDIDLQSGRITVSPPRSPARPTLAAGLSLSLIGADAIAVTASDCVFTALPGNRRRCTFDLAITNQLGFTDLVTPTTFPQPPPGTVGLLVFPFTSAALGVVGGTAVPSPDWDHEPINLFNDFAQCSGNNRTSDCYRYELFPEPLYAAEATAPRQVGFDVDRNAHSLQAYIVVAADLRDNPPLTLTLSGEPSLCGFVGNTVGALAPSPIGVGAAAIPLVGPQLLRGFCSFDFSSVPPGASVLSANLRFYQSEVFGDPYGVLGDLLVDHLDYGAVLDAGDFDLAALESTIGTIATDAAIGYKTLDVTAAVLNDIDASRTRSQFRARFATEVLGALHFAVFDGTAEPNVPQLVITYRGQ